MALILKPHVEKKVIDTFKPPVKPVGEAKVIEGTYKDRCSKDNCR